MKVRPSGISVANFALFFSPFFIRFDISKAELHYRQAIRGDRLGKWGLAVDGKEERGEQKWAELE